MSIYLLIYLVLLAKLCWNTSHTLITLMVLESLSTVVILSMISLYSMGWLSAWGVTLMSVAMVCEGVLGLGILIKSVRTTGSDSIKFNHMV